jgi:hypothetical protein
MESLNRKCISCGKGLVFTRWSRKDKKYCNNVCQNTFQNLHNLRQKPIPYSKQFLEDLYLKDKKSLSQIAKQLGTHIKGVHRWLIRYEIPTRPFSTKGTVGWAKGVPKSLEMRKKLADAHRGEKSYTWKGGITPIHKKIRNTFELKLWRKAVLERDDYTCQFCGVKKEKGMEVDHIKSFAKYPELRTSIENGRTLCNPCHRKTDTYGIRSKTK